MKSVVLDLGRFIRSQPRLLLWIFSAGILSYGFAIANVSLSIDEEVHLFSDNTLQFAQQGRWGIALLRFIFGIRLPLPFFEPAVALVVLCGSALVWCHLFVLATGGKLEHSPWLELFAVLYVTMPTNAYYFSFNTYNFAVSFGYLFAALFCLFSFVWVTEQRKWMSLVAAALAATMAIAIYQSLIMVCVVGIAIAYLLNLEGTRSRTTILEGAARFIFLLLPLVAGYLLSSAVDFFVVPIQVYVDQFFNWGKLDNEFIYRWLTNYCLAFFRGEGFLGGQIVLPLSMLAALALLVFAWRAIGERQIVQLGLFLVVLLSPFLLSFALGTPMPNRTQQAFPLAYTAIVLIVVLQLGLQHRGELIAIILCVLVIIWNGQANTRTFLSEYLAFERDKVVANEVAAQLYQSGWTGMPAPFVVVGSYVHKEERYLLKSETIGASFFGWDKGSRAPIFMSVLGYPLRAPTPNEREQAMAIAHTLPVWPLPGSVTFSHGIAIAKMSQTAQR